MCLLAAVSTYYTFVCFRLSPSDFWEAPLEMWQETANLAKVEEASESGDDLTSVFR